jgi:hypothetical protein
VKTAVGEKQKKKPQSNYKLKLNDASEIELKAIITDVSELGTAIEQEIIKRQLPQIQAYYVANKPIAFPGLCLNQHWISKSDEKLHWSEIEKITIGPEKVEVKEKGVKKTWLSAPIAQFPNICVLEAILEHIQMEHGFGLEHKEKEDRPKKKAASKVLPS